MYEKHIKKKIIKLRRALETIGKQKEEKAKRHIKSTKTKVNFIDI